MTNEWVQMELAIADFDSAAWSRVVAKTTSAGIRYERLSDLGNTATNQRLLYDLDRTCAADVPGRDGFPTWIDYHRSRLRAPSHHPAGVIIAIDGSQWVGLSETSHRSARSFAFNEMTGVLRSHRRRGIAAALKTLSIDFARERGVQGVRTVHHPLNTPMITLNENLGYRHTQWDYPYPD